MRRIAIVLALCVGAFGLLACGGGSGDDTDAFEVIVTDGGDDDIDAGDTTTCNPVAQTGCESGEKCTWISAGGGLGHTGCAPNGDKEANGACTAPETGADDCVAGYFCLNSLCSEICNSAPNSCPSGFICSGYSDLWEDLENVGQCNPTCDPVTQDCPTASEGCYLQAVTGESSCAGIPAGAETQTQGEACYGPSAGVCYLNGCAKGYGANLPTTPGSQDSVCAFFCHTIDNWVGHEQGLSGDPGEVTCGTTFGGARPDGPGPSFECRYIQSFYSNTQDVAEHVGMCLDDQAWGGSCAIFDWPQLQLDVADGTANSETYCTDHPDRCMVDCISIATFEAGTTDAPFQARYGDFVSRKQWGQLFDELIH